MKYAKIFSVLAAAAALFIGCTKEMPGDLEEIKVSSSFVSIPEAGGSQSIKIETTVDWSIESVLDDKGKDATTWLSVSPTSGPKGISTIVFSAEGTLNSRTAVIKINVNGKTQYINATQQWGDGTVSASTCAEVLAGPDGKTFQVEGVVTRIAESATYGNWYINDGTGEVYIYGTKYQGQTKQGAIGKLGIEVGDVVKIEGPKTTYNGTVELVDVDVLNVTKSLIKVIDPEETGAKEGGILTVKVIAKGGNIEVKPNDEWIKIGSLGSLGDTTLVNLYLDENFGGAREGSVVFSSGTSSVETVIKQSGAISEVTCAEFLAAEVGSAQYKLSGVITKVEKADYGNFYMKDFSGEVYVYGLGAKGTFQENNLKVGDIITIVGTRADYKGSPQMGGAQFESVKRVTTMKAAEVASLADDNKQDPQNYILLTGTVTKPTAAGSKFDLETYGNFDLVDESGSVYVYGVSTGWNGATKKFGTLGVKEGDVITIVAYKTSYNGNVQVVGMYVSHKSGVDDGGGVTGAYATTLAYEKGASCYDDIATKVNDTEGVTTVKIGSSSKVGSFTVTVPKGASEVSFYAVAWKGASGVKGQILDGETELLNFDVAAQDGVSGSDGYVVTVTDADKKVVTFAEKLTADKVLTFTASARVIFFGIQAK